MHQWLSSVLFRLDVSDILNCRLVCKEWSEICLDEVLWKHQFEILFGSSCLMDARSMLKSTVLPNIVQWHNCCNKLKLIVQQKQLQRIMTPEDQSNLSSSISILLHLAICRAFIGYPDKDTTDIFSTPETFLFRYKPMEITRFIIRYNLSPIIMSKKQLRSTIMERRLSETELIVTLCTILKGKLRVQLFVLRELFEHICGPINSCKITLPLFTKYDTLFITFQKKATEEQDSCWIILRSQIRFIVNDKESLLLAVKKILQEHKTNGIRENPFRQKFERCTGLSFGLCSNKSLKKYINSCPDLFQYVGSKLFLIPN